ncbi:Crp/Fnr family transcriptional regulator [Azotosporobacter soli]|uniref:Crp/Fnr family transcriptional regulator n=1 Tax=Azotosporobacter soli TaxID=3055040 RepID=UPI0031FF318E
MLRKLLDLFKPQEKLAEFLSRVPKEIKERCLVKTIAAGEAITQKGEPVNCVYILIHGDTRVINEFPNGERYSFAHLTPISFIGELEVFAEEEAYACNVEAETDCEVMIVVREDFEKWLKLDAEFLLTVVGVLAKKMYISSFEAGEIKFFSGIRKLQAYIVKYCRTIKEDEQFLINKKRQQIADEIGTSVKTVNRNIEALKESEMLSVKKGKIYITKEQYAKMVAVLERC